MLLQIILQNQPDLTVLAIEKFGFVAISTLLASFLISWGVYKYKQGHLEIRISKLETKQEIDSSAVSEMKGDLKAINGKLDLLIAGKIKNG